MGRIAAFSLALAALAIALVNASCHTKCRFNFCNGVFRFYLPAFPDRAFTGAICDSYGRVKVGHVDATGEAFVHTHAGHKDIPISHWSPAGLKQRFSPSFFKSFSLYKYGKRSGIGHEVPQQNQGAFLRGQCFFVPLKAYQVLDKKGNVIDNVHPRNPKVDCVGFTTY